MFLTAVEWCSFLGGKLEGDATARITHPAPIEEAGEHAITFIAHPKYAHFAYTTRATLILVGPDFKPEHPISSTLIRVENPYLAFTRVLQKFSLPFDHLSGIDSSAFVSTSASVHPSAYIGAFSYIGENATIESGVKVFPQVFVGKNATIGKNSVLYAGTRVYHDCRIGSHCIIHSGTVIGSDGFGFAPQPNGAYLKIPQLGNVEIGDEVEIGSNTTIDRATMGTTRIGKGVKIDNLVQIAHNVEIGDHTVIAAQSGISGSSRIGRYCQIGGQVGLVGHISIADRTRINAQSGVSKSIREPGRAVTGTPAYDYKSMLRSQAIFRNLPELEQRISRIEKWIMGKENNI